MGLLLHHLDEPDVREATVLLWSAEWAELGDQRRECYGKALTEAGWEAFARLMPEALAEHDDDWLLTQMDVPAYWQRRLPRRTRSGRMSTYTVNRREACRQLCLGEFNVAYIRGLAHALRDRGETHAVVYRAGDAGEPRSECSAWEGDHVALEQVISGHRVRYWPRPGRPTAWSIPSGVNCHHSIRAAA